MTKKRKTHEAPKAKPRVATTLRAASAMTGLSMQTIGAAKAAGCEAFRANRTVNLDELISWLAENPQHVGEEEVSFELERALRERARRKIDELRLGELQGKLVRKEDAVGTMYGSMIAAKQTLLGFRPGWAARIAALTGAEAARIDEMLEQRDREFLTELSSGLWKPSCPHCRRRIDTGG